MLLPPYNPAPHYRRIYQQVFIKRYHIPVLADLTDKFPNFTKPFDFIYDWGLLHHIGPRKRKTYTKNVATSLKPKGLYLSLCFNELDSAFPGRGKRRNTQRGTTVYLSCESDLKRLWAPYFNILHLHVFRAEGKTLTHVFNFALLEKIL